MTTKTRYALQRELSAWGFMLPHLVLFLVFMLVPLVINAGISFYNWSLLGKKAYIGLGNFERIIKDDKFWLAVKNTVVFALISVPLVMIVGLLFASLLNQRIYGKLWILVALVSPTFFGSVGILTTWRWIFASHSGGLANYYLQKLGLIDRPLSWFEDPVRAWAIIIFVTVWWIVGFSVLLYLGALRRIPKEQYEAAELDGAGPLLRFFHVTLPWMRNVLFFDVVRQVLLAFGLFDQVYFFTGGGPAGSTRTMVYYLYSTAINVQALGRAAAISWYIFAVVLAFALIHLYILTRSIKSAEEG
ncbi:ABC-type transporter, integral membrane subunit [Spirochaeta thermophila DSM 6578]|uniref:ABC-type transporter, integral membrane subunit n=1 Tax=Winmispira thermophila (strain ATCC 700085 / DSM 6578 / Z-1203) TaxID=869211 RepID=G0GF64_WINT7|nr:sugar ABC transporter permease [Spirochaeta thermophila]AEJ60763.1 ABC-type transporter, integral membrane subunit [Spirochaeta thermophila DSM 6578]